MNRALTRGIAATALAAAAALAPAGAALAAPADPAGNNGTIKIDGKPWDSAPDNEPHVGCRFEVDFYGYDLGSTATVTFTVQAPTGGGEELLTSRTIQIGEDPAGGGTDLDASRRFNLGPQLQAYEPQPQQGYHVKATVHATGSKGADVKHKVFWVADCDPYGGGGYGQS
ncbi:MAG: hypothetical protein ACTHN8_17640 [Angustibacter sp.]